MGISVGDASISRIFLGEVEMDAAYLNEELIWGAIRALAQISFQDELYEPSFFLLMSGDQQSDVDALEFSGDQNG